MLACLLSGRGDPGRKARMKTIVKVAAELVALREDGSQYAILIREKVRSGSVRTICDVNVGETVRDGDLDLVMQILEDCFAAAIDRTIGRQLVLAF
jgi:hypothetical protein